MVWEAGAEHAGFSAGKPWLPVPADHLPLSADQQADASSVLQHYRDTLAFRKSQPPMLDGGMRFLETNSDVLAFLREKSGETLLFIFNLHRGPQEVLLPEGVSVREIVAMPGYGQASCDGGLVKLDAFDVFCAAIKP